MMLRITTAALVAAAVVLSACSRLPGGIDKSTDTAADSPNGWTTLGNRSLPAGPVVPAPKVKDAQWPQYDPPDLYPASKTQAVHFISADDGTQLAVYVTLPAGEDGVAAAGKFPTVLSFTGYNTDPATGGSYSFLPRHGYAYVSADARGTGRSQGEWDGLGSKEQGDYRAIVDWIVAQDWADGKVADFGESYVGITGLFNASQNHPAVKAVFAQIALGDLYRDLAFAGGDMSTVFMPAWLGLVTAGSVIHPNQFADPEYYTTFVQRLVGLPSSFQVKVLTGALLGDPEIAYDGDFHAQRSPSEMTAAIRVPTFLTGGLRDIFQRGEPLNYERLKANVPAKLMIGPWHHTNHGSGLPVDGVPSMNQMILMWFDHYVKGIDTGAERIPNVTQYVNGYGHYVTSPDWPHPQARAQTLYLHGDKSISDAAPAADESPNYVLQQPLGGLCDMNTVQWSAGIAGNLPFPCLENNSYAYASELVFDSAPFEEDVYLNGPMQANIWVSTTALDANVSVRIDDMDGDSGSQISSGLQVASMRAVDETRSRYLDGVMIQPWHPFTQDSKQDLALGEAVMVPVEIFPSSAMIAKGHHLRISIGSSDVMRGTMPVPMLIPAAAGLMTVYSDAQRASSIVVPVVPLAALN